MGAPSPSIRCVTLHSGMKCASVGLGCDWNLFLSELRLSLAIDTVQTQSDSLREINSTMSTLYFIFFCGAAGPHLQDCFIIFLLLTDKNLNMRVFFFI